MDAAFGELVKNLELHKKDVAGTLDVRGREFNKSNAKLSAGVSGTGVSFAGGGSHGEKRD